MSKVSREYTIKIIELLDEGILDGRELAEDLLRFMSEADVADAYFYNRYETLEG